MKRTVRPPPHTIAATVTMVHGPEVSRKLALLKRTGLFNGASADATIARATTFDDLHAAYRLVHDIYVRSRFIRPDPSGLRLRIFEATDDMATFVAKIDGGVVAVLSVLGDSERFGLPSDSMFRPELDELRKSNTRLCEVTNQVIAEPYRKSALTTELMRCATAHFFAAGYQRAVATVSPGHDGFYRILNFRQFGTERSYSHVMHDPVVALCVNPERYRKSSRDHDDVRQFINRYMWNDNPYRDGVSKWAADAQRSFCDASLLRRLFVTESGMMRRLDDGERTLLRAHWGSALYDAVAGNARAHASPAPRRSVHARPDRLQVSAMDLAESNPNPGARSAASKD